MTRENRKKIFVVSLQILLALLLVLGSKILPPELKGLYASYFADILLPFGFYFLLSIVQTRTPVFQHWWVKALAVFGLCATSEILQYFGIYALAVVFDPVDFLMYAAGVLLAAALDRLLLSRVIPFWD